MITKKNIRVLTIAAFLALGVVFGACTCQGPKPNVSVPAETRVVSPTPSR